MAAPRTTNLNSLGDDVLGVIFLLLPLKDRARSLPLVCRKWYRITAHPSMWSTVDMTPRDSSVVPWLRQHSQGLRHLTLHLQRASGQLTSVLAAIGLSMTQLQQLRLTTVYRESLDIAELACISHLHRLTSLHAAYINTPHELETLDGMLGCLPALEVIDLEFCLDAGNTVSQPLDEFPPSLLRCTRLTALDLAASGDPGEYTCNVPAGITVLQRLQHLGLRHFMAGPLPRSMRQMTQLTTLAVTRHVSSSTDLLFRDACGLVPLPPSLQALDASVVYADVLHELTALKHLSLDNIVEYHASGETLDLSMLAQLTFLELNWAGDPQLMALKGCTGLRTLHLSELETDVPLPLPHKQLTRLQLQIGEYDIRDILVMISELAQLEVLEVLGVTWQAFEVLAFDATALYKLPKLRLVDLSGSLLWDDASVDKPVQGPHMKEYLPLRVVRHLMSLQRANPNIEWVLGSD